MNEEDKIQLIESYLLKRLPEDELLAFEQRLKNDPELVTEVAFNKSIINGIELNGKLSKFREHLNSLREESSKNTVIATTSKPADNSKDHKEWRVKQGQWRWMSGIAAIFLITFGSYLYIHSHSDQALFSKYYQPYPGNVQISVLRGEGTDQSLEQQAIQAYNNGSYQHAVDLLEAVIKKNPADVNWCIFLGIAYLELNDFKQAEYNLNKVVLNSQSTYFKQGQWYLALTFMKDHQTAKARAVLENLKRGKGVYSQKAKNLLEDM